MKQFDPKALMRPDLLELVPYSSARGEYAMEADRHFLDANENPFPSAVNRYPDPQQQDLKKELASRKQIPSQQIILGNGSDELLDLLFRCFCLPNQDNVLCLPPTYGMYGILAKINAVELREIPLDLDFQPQVEDILQAVDARTKMLFLCSPNNPTGNSFSQARVRRILEGFPGIVVLDEAYADFSQTSWLPVLEEYPNLFVLQTFSKAYGMAGIRLGAGYASPEIIQLLQKIKPPYNVNSLTQELALERLKQEGDLEQEVRQILEQRQILASALERLDYVQKVYPSDANFLLVKVDKAKQRYLQFLEAGLVLRDRSMELNCEECLRITVGTPEENALLLKVARKLQQLKTQL